MLIARASCGTCNQIGVAGLQVNPPRNPPAEAPVQDAASQGNELLELLQHRDVNLVRIDYANNECNLAQLLDGETLNLLWGTRHVRLDRPQHRPDSGRRARVFELLPHFTPGMQSFTAYAKHIDDIQTTALARGLAACPELRRIDLSHNKITAEGARALSRYLDTCTQLTELNLAHNTIGHDGAVALAPFLASCEHLQMLELTNNGVGQVGAMTLAHSLIGCQRGLVLHLMNNNVGNVSAVRAVLGDIRAVYL
jgi:Leucine-rich repeat (LRR) protein